MRSGEARFTVRAGISTSPITRRTAMRQASPDPAIATAIPRKSAKRRRITNDRLISLALIAPSVIAIAIFVYYFIARTAYISLVRWDDFQPDFTFVGLRNYVRLFANQRFQIDIHNTIVFTIVFIVTCLGIGLVLAALLDMRIKGEAIFRNIFMFPLAI